jgi:dTDP-4-amino-4,6-dideoxygalactose transaminase
MIRLSKSSLSDEEKKAVMSVLDLEFLGMGPEVKAFEDELERYIGRPVRCVVNGTSAIHLALQAVGVGVGDDVIVPSLTYVATYQAISATGANAISCDVDPVTLCLDPNDVAQKITNKTKAIIPVHYSGGVGHIKEIYKHAEKHNLRIIEDAAHAFGTQVENNRVGSHGDITCFSFDGIKNITSGEGGCVVTDDQDVLQKVSDARLLGVEKDSEKRYQGQRSWDFDVIEQGWRFHMSDVMAALGRIQLKRFSKLSEIRQKLSKLYDEKLSTTSLIRIEHNYDDVVPHIYVIRCSNENERDELKEFLENNDVQTGIHYFPNHKLTRFKNNVDLPETEKAYNTMLTLPLHPDLTEENVEKISSLIHLSLGKK